MTAERLRELANQIVVACGLDAAVWFQTAEKRAAATLPILRAAVDEATAGWKCFHCDELFTNRAHAAEHFGWNEGAIPACRIRGSEGHLVTYIRRLEAELTSYRNESDDITKAWLAKEAEHAEALRREEEKGYARGVRDMNKQGYCPEPTKHSNAE